MFPHTVTVYNVCHAVNPATIENTATSYITVLRGVLLIAAKAVSIHNSGQISDDKVMLYIPYGVEAVDGLTGAAKRYVPPSEFRKADDKSGLWTLAAGTPYDMFFVKGEVVEPGADFQTISREYDAYRVTQISDFDFGGDMRHWKVGGA